MHKVKIPKTAVFAPHVKKSKVRHLEQGFRELGTEVVYDRNLTAQIIDSETYPFRLVFSKGKAKADCILDITASRYKLHEELVTKDNFYFKTHLAKTDIKKNPRIFPMPQSTSNLRYFSYLPHLRALRDRKRFPIDIVGIFVNTDDGLRQKAVRHIKEQPWRSEAWMIQHPRLERPKIPAALISEKLRCYDHWLLQAKSKVCLALPGARKRQGASISFRHVEIWGMGGVVFSIRGGTVVVGNPKGIVIEFRKDLTDFNRKVNRLLRNREERIRIGRLAMKHFDRHHTPKAHARHVLKTIQEVGI